jgi:hypothetical protein
MMTRIDFLKIGRRIIKKVKDLPLARGQGCMSFLDTIPNDKFYWSFLC